MKQDAINALLDKLDTAKSETSIWQWCCDEIDFSRAPDYESAFSGPFNPDLAPYMREPMESTIDPAVRETIFLKCSRAGGSEMLLLMPIRYYVACQPGPIIYASAQQETTEDFFKERIVKGMKLAGRTMEKYQKAIDAHGVKPHALYMQDCHIIATWSKSASGFKQRGAALALADEVSSWPDVGVLEALRKRMDTFHFPHIVIISSPDHTQKRSSDEDPIFQEFDKTDQRYWFMKDPRTGKLFKFEFGGENTPYGLKWDKKAKNEHGEWNLNRVAETAHYITPDGTIISGKDRMRVIKTGQWIPTKNIGMASFRRGYHLNQFHVPFQSGNFDSIAIRWLSAVQKGHDAIRVFKYEVLAEKCYTEKITTDESKIIGNIADYQMGERFTQSKLYEPAYRGYSATAIMTVDVQKENMWYCVREWVGDGDSGLIRYGKVERWIDLKEIAVKHNVEFVFIDNSYTERRNEVIDQCCRGSMVGAFPCYGRVGLRDRFKQVRDYDIKKSIDPYDGSGLAGRYKITTITHNPDMFKNMLLAIINGVDPHKWKLPQGTDKLYMNQMTSEMYIDGRWEKLRPNNHLWDCEVLQLVGAVVCGIFRHTAKLADLNSLDSQNKELINSQKREEVPIATYDPMILDEEDAAW